MIFDEQSQQPEIKAAIKKARETRTALKEEAENAVLRTKLDRFQSACSVGRRGLTALTAGLDRS
jgi:hypothetical protein